MSKTVGDRDFLKDIIAARKRLIWAWAEMGATPQQTLAKLRRNRSYDLKFVQDTLETHPAHTEPDGSIYTELSAANKIATLCADQVVVLEKNIEILTKSNEEARALISDLIDAREKLEGKLEKYEDSEGKPLVHKERKQRRLIELEKRLDMMENDVEERLEDVERRVEDLEGEMDES